MKKKKINKQETKTNGNTYKNVVNKPGYLKLKNKQNNNRQDRDCSKLYVVFFIIFTLTNITKLTSNRLQ